MKWNHWFQALIQNRKPLFTAVPSVDWASVWKPPDALSLVGHLCVVEGLWVLEELLCNEPWTPSYLLATGPNDSPGNSPKSQAPPLPQAATPPGYPSALLVCPAVWLRTPAHPGVSSGLAVVVRGHRGSRWTVCLWHVTWISAWVWPPASCCSESGLWIRSAPQPHCSCGRLRKLCV